MTALLRTDFDDFLFAPIADEANGMPLTLLSVLARSGVDPWVEAADLAALSRDAAAQKLVVILRGVPNGPSPGADAATMASRLVGLLHRSPKPKPVPSMPAVDVPPPRPSAETGPRPVRMAIYFLIALIVMLVVNWALNHQ